MPKNAMRQPIASPTHAAIGTPSTDASDQPRKMKVMSRARCSGGAITPTAAAACGVKSAAPSIVIARTGNSVS